jgi:fatty acid/phospholipid biosynthesis enzyme
LLQRFGIDKENIAKHPEVLTIFPTTVENHTMLLEEGGCTGVTAQELVRYINNLCTYIYSVVLVN